MQSERSGIRPWLQRSIREAVGEVDYQPSIASVSVWAWEVKQKKGKRRKKKATEQTIGGEERSCWRHYLTSSERSVPLQDDEKLAEGR
jgi:hypothetical protein